MWYSALHSEQMTDCLRAFLSRRCFSFDDWAAPIVMLYAHPIKEALPSDPAASRSIAPRHLAESEIALP